MKNNHIYINCVLLVILTILSIGLYVKVDAVFQLVNNTGITADNWHSLLDTNLGIVIHADQKIMYRQDSLYLMEQYKEEIKFIEQVKNMEIGSLMANEVWAIMEVVGMQANGNISNEPDLQAFSKKISDAISRYNNFQPPLHTSSDVEP